jgi:dihydrofolate synthase/folylpolyglutamate synthase
LRIEVLRTAPLVIADAAHNVASLAALIATLRDVPAARRTAVFSVSRDKDIAEMLQIAGDFFDRLVLTQFTDNPRATPVAELAAIAASATPAPCTAIESPPAAWQAALAQSGPDDLVCITGSFFLAAELRDAILNSKQQPGIITRFDSSSLPPCSLPPP